MLLLTATCLLVLLQLVRSDDQVQVCSGIDLTQLPTVDEVAQLLTPKPFLLQFQNSIGEDPGQPLFLTPLIEAGRIKEAQTLSRVRPAIGGVSSYSGFLTVDKECGSNLFFWYFPAQTHPDSAPLVTWLQGGPGSSSMFGLFEELGPFNHFPEGLKSRQFSWNVKNNLVFFDQPVGTGFTFTTKGCFVSNQTMVANDMYNALLQFFKLFPNLQKNKFVLTGESYAGHYIPAIAFTIHKNNPGAELKINLYGMMIGDGWTDPREQIGYAEYLYQTGLIGDEIKKEMETYQKCFVELVDKGEWLTAHKISDAILALYDNNARVSEYNYLPKSKGLSNWQYFINSSSTRKSIHVGTLDFKFDSKEVQNHLGEDYAQSVKRLVEELLEHYPIVFYAGQVDVICGYPMMVHFLHSLTWSGQQQYLASQRSLWFEGGELAGYIKGHHHLYDVMVRAAGHMVPADQPFWAYQLVNAFTSGNISSLTSQLQRGTSQKNFS